jgi:hypothetical protein
MELRTLRQFLVHLLISLVITVWAGNPVEAAQRKNFSSKFLCNAIKLGCAKKRARSPTKKHAVGQTTKQTSLKTVSKSKDKPKTMTAPAQPVAPSGGKLVTKPRPKPVVVQHDNSQLALAEIQHELPVARLAARNPSTVQTPADDIMRCKVDLHKLGVVFSVPERVQGTGECTVLDPVQLRGVETTLGRVELPGHPTLNCAFARQFAVWLSDIAVPATAALGEARLSSLSTGPGYQCRGRNGDSSAKISEHAFGNAIDIDGMTLTNDKRIEIPDVLDKQAPDRRMLMALRTSACGYFTTVLGPGSNAAHASHFHFDLGTHGKSGNYRICE